MNDGDAHHDEATATTKTPIAVPLAPQRLNVPSLRERFALGMHWCWDLIREVLGQRLPHYTIRDAERAALTFRIRAGVRWVGAWIAPPVVFAGLYVAGKYLIAPTTDVEALLRSVLPAASLTSGLLAAGLMNATAQSKELRRRRVDALRKCQGELQPVRRAFDRLYISFNDRLVNGEHLQAFLDRVWRVGFEWILYDGSDTSGRLFSVEKIGDIVAALEELSGTLSRPKHYRHLVEELGGPRAADVHTLEGVVLTRWPGVKNALAEIRPLSDDSWRTLSFWEDFINESLKLATRAQELSIEVHYQDLTRLRAMFAHLVWLVVAGVAVPLAGLAFPSHQVQQGLALVAVVGMLSVLASTLWLLYRWITEQRLHNEGRLY